MAGSQLPRTPVGDAIAWVLSRLLTGAAGEEEIAGQCTEAFLQRFSAAMLMSTGQRGARLLGDVEVAEVVEFGEHRAQVAVVGATGMRGLISAVVEDAPPHRLAGLGLAPAPQTATTALRHQVIALNGASSSGKSSIAAALQDRLDDVWLHVSVDDFVRMLPVRGIGQLEKVVRAGHALIASFVAGGLPVIYDGALGAPLLAHLSDQLGDADLLCVGVMCGDDVLAAREAERADRLVGQAKIQNQAVHHGVRYDVQVDTSELSPSACADAIAVALQGLG